MKKTQNKFMVQSKTELLLLAMLVWGCTASGALEDGMAVVVNRTNQPLILKVWELESSHVVDPIPGLPLEENQMTVIQPEESLSLSDEEIDGDYSPGKNIRFFLYTIRDDSAHLSSALDLMHGELECYDYRVAIKKGTGGFFTAGSSGE